tara:strand:- start:427 stop:765 length:339 start_codon:yes stop_codon:yes gene_type:complete
MPIFSIIAPSVTALTSGNIYKAGAQFIINKSIEKETGKNSLTIIKEELNKTFIKEEISEKIQENSFNEEFRVLVEKRISLTRKKLENQNIQKLLKQRIKITRSILSLDNTTQ